MKAYKVLRKDLKSPYQDFQYEMGKKYICDDFDKDSNNDYSRGFYAGDIDSILYANLSNGKIVVECEMSGDFVDCGKFKTRWSEQKIIRIVPMIEVEALIIEAMERLDYDLYHAIFPYNPLQGEPVKFDKNIHLPLLIKWDSVRDGARNSVRGSVGYSVSDSVRNSVWNSVWVRVRNSVWNSVSDSVWGSVWGSVSDSVSDSVRNSVWGSVWNSVSDSVWGSVYVYISHLFPNVKNWKYIDHEEGENPFQSCVDLWHMNIVPSFDGTAWRLHSGEKAEVIFEISKMDLTKEAVKHAWNHQQKKIDNILKG